MCREVKICSGFAPGGRAAKFGGPVRTGSSSILESGRLALGTERDKLSLPALARPEEVALGFGAPPLIVIPMELLPEAAATEEPAPVPPGFPSGDMATRAARLP